jgi:predicted metal-binding membrane protein
MMPLQIARDRPGLVAGMLATGGLAWWWTVERMEGMSASPGTDLGTLGWFTGSWVVMMAAMMLPSLAPTVAAYATLTKGDRPGRSLLFGCGYLFAWTIAGVGAYGLLVLGNSLLGSELSWYGGGQWLSGAVLALAAVYQLTPSKRANLTRCRAALANMRGVSGELRGVSRDGWSAALATGLRNGGWCIGCSWALMAALFALGVMSLIWMAVIAALVALEKTGPWPSAARLATATVLAVLAVGILLAPEHIPGLVVPGSRAMHTMQAMG